MSKKRSNGANGSKGHHGSIGRSSDVGRALSDAQMELLRHALVEHGKRMAVLEETIDKAMDDLRLMKDVVGRTQDRVRKIADKLGVELEE